MSLQNESGAKAAENFLLRGKLRKTEAALAAAQHQLKETQARLDTALRLQRPGAQRLLPLAHRHTRELSTSTTHSAHSAASTRLRESHNAPNLIAAIQKLIAGRRSLEPEDVAAGVLQAQLRGFLQRRRYRECTQLHAGVSGSVELRCGGQSVTGYVITVVRNGCCWEVRSRAAVAACGGGGLGGSDGGRGGGVALAHAGALPQPVEPAGPQRAGPSPNPSPRTLLRILSPLLRWSTASRNGATSTNASAPCSPPPRMVAARRRRRTFPRGCRLAAPRSSRAVNARARPPVPAPPHIARPPALPAILTAPRLHVPPHQATASTAAPRAKPRAKPSAEPGPASHRPPDQVAHRHALRRRHRAQSACGAARFPLPLAHALALPFATERGAAAGDRGASDGDGGVPWALSPSPTAADTRPRPPLRPRPVTRAHARACPLTLTRPRCATRPLASLPSPWYARACKHARPPLPLSFPH